jgi:transcriptional regulator with XRE-family HTH domain
MGNYGDQFNSAIAGELRAQRARISMTIEQVVERSGISKSAVLYYLNEKRQIPMPAFYELCAALEADPAELFMAAQKKVQEL